jgi:hypothetical protein
VLARDVEGKSAHKLITRVRRIRGEHLKRVGAAAPQSRRQDDVEACVDGGRSHAEERAPFLGGLGVGAFNFQEASFGDRGLLTCREAWRTDG